MMAWDLPRSAQAPIRIMRCAGCHRPGECCVAADAEPAVMDAWSGRLLRGRAGCLGAFSQGPNGRKRVSMPLDPAPRGSSAPCEVHPRASVAQTHICRGTSASPPSSVNRRSRRGRDGGTPGISRWSTARSVPARHASVSPARRPQYQRPQQGGSGPAIRHVHTSHINFSDNWCMLIRP